MNSPRPLRVLLILGHPRGDSLCGALATAYRDGATRAGAEVVTLALGDLAFAHDVVADSPENQPLEPDLQRARDLLDWAEHLVFVYPTWWGTMPALLKGFLDRLVAPGFAFRFYGPGAAEWEGLWKGKSAQLITTMDTPPPIYKWLFRAPGTNAMRRATLGFCGVAPVHVLTCGSVRTSDIDQLERWIERARRAGFALRSGVHSPIGRVARRATPWLKALRLQFYPMSWAAYSVGALLGAAAGLDWSAYLWGYLLIFCLEAATVFCNERADIDTDRANQNYGPFTGGSRVLLDGGLSPARLRRAVGYLLVAAFMAAGLALASGPAGTGVVLWMLLATVITLGYTVYPLKLSYRSLGELDVAFTHSALVLLLGVLLQGGAFGAPEPWLLSLALGLAILPSIILAGVPDRAADARVGKHTLAERWGNAVALRLAGAAVITSALLALLCDQTSLGGGLFHGMSLVVIPHAALCLALLWHARSRGPETLARIDGLLIAALTYMLWFVIIPGYHLL
ncbi:NAD(P)H-dependent oxidoreductase [Salinisphaera aquimarina]|uniref:NAD(P)H-dependent oxidoreductase n=1 Tax=Salinisphaera aquimarina TaxID=2094031 RepID=A0ABV7EXG1_9GAMM